MNKLTFATTILAFSILTPAIAHAAAVPCEDMLKQLREAEKTATLSEEDKSKVSDLETKGVERCKADDDKRADKFFDEALKIVTKK